MDWYAERHRHFVTDELPPLLRETVRRGVIADLDCADGATLQALHRAGVLDQGYGIDLSETRVTRAEQVPGVTEIVADATSVPRPDASVDGVICSQVIEHVPDQASVVSEIARLLRPGGWWYIGSCQRGRVAWWVYRRDGRWWLDPTHVREYRSEFEFRAAVSHPALGLGALRSEPMRFPVVDVVLRVLRRDGGFYLRHSSLVRLRSLRMRVPGYCLVGVVGHRL